MSPPRAASLPPGGWGVPLLLAAALAATLLLLHLPALDFGLLALDDVAGTVENGRVRGGITAAGVEAAFRDVHGGWQGGGGLYVPLVELSYMVDVELSGLSPRGFHRTNVVLHAAAMALLLLVLWRATGDPWRSALAAALVALHPMRVESVAWVAERKDLLSLLFLLLAVACHLRFARSGRGAWYAALLACFLLSLLSKPGAMVLPALLLVLDAWPLGRLGGAGGGRWRRAAALAAEKVPLLLLSGAFAWLTWSLHRERAPLAVPFPLAERLAHSLTADLYYLWKTFWPRDLAFRFFRTTWEGVDLPLPLAATGVALVTAAAARLARPMPFLLAGWCWYLAALLPVSGITGRFGVQWLSARYTLLPHVGLAVAAAWLAAELLPARRFRAAPLGAVLLLAALALLSRRELAWWTDGATLLGRGVEEAGEDPVHRSTFARELVRVGDLPGARREQEKLLPRALHPGEGVGIQLQYLEILDRAGDRAEAVAAARRFLAADPNFFLTRLRLAHLLRLEGRVGEAGDEYRRVLAVPGLPPPVRAEAEAGLGALSPAGPGGRGAP